MALRRRRHAERVSNYIVTWPGDEREQLQYDGEVFWLPAINEVAVPGPDSPFRYESAKDGDRGRVAGTIHIYDRIRNVDGHRHKIFNADEFVNWVEEVRHDLLDRGMIICDLVSEVPEALAQGRPLWEKSRDEWARITLETELDRRRRWEEKGLPAPPSSSEEKVIKALAHLRERGRRIVQIPTTDLVAALSGEMAPEPTNGKPAAPAPTHQEQLQAVDGRSLFLKAQNFGIKLVKAQLEGLMLDDKETCEAVAELIRARAEAAAP